MRLQSLNFLELPRKSDSTELSCLEPFFRENPPHAIKHFQLLHSSPLSRTFLVNFRNDSKIESPLVLKSYGAGDYEYAAQEIQHLGWIKRFINETGLDQVLVPEVVWAAPDKGLFATRYIPGENLDAVNRKLSRLWSFSAGHKYTFWVTILLNWHRALHDSIRLPRENLPVADHDATDWTKWVQRLTRADRLPIAWRKDVGAKLERLEKVMATAHQDSKIHHGDFTPWNVRVEHSGQLWVLDWRRLEKGHWLEGAYRFIYALRISALSPLAKPRFFARLTEEAENVLEKFDHEASSVQKELFQLRAVLRNLFYLCRHPSLSFKQRQVQRFWIKELTEVIEKCTP